MALRTVNLESLRLSPTVRSLIPSMYGAARRGISANALQRGILAAGGSAGSRTQFLQAYSAVRNNYRLTQGVRFAANTYQPALHPDHMLPARLNTIHRYQATIEVRDRAGNIRYLTIGYDDPTTTKGELVDTALEIADAEAYTAASGVAAQGGWTSGVWIEGRSRV